MGGARVAARSTLRDALDVRANLRRVFVPPVTTADGHARLRPLDGLRAFAVLWVVVFHAGWYARFSLLPPRWFALALSPWLLPLWRGDFGVDLFFVLSGFLIAGLLLDEQTKTSRIALRRFYVRRLWRLWPALLAVALLELFTDDPNRWNVWANVLYLNDFVAVGIVALGWTWSLAIEEQFYLVCPWLLRALAPLRPAWRLAALALLTLALVGLGAYVVVTYDLHPWDAEIVGSLDMRRWGFAFDVFYDKPWMRAGALLAGVMGAVVYRLPRAMAALGKGGARTVIGFVAALFAMLVATHWPLAFLTGTRFVEVAYLASFRTVFALGAAYCLLVTLSTHPLGRLLARPLSSRALYPIAQLAYAAYLVNPMVTMLFGRLAGPFLATHDVPPLLLLVPADATLTFLVAAAIHVFIERPGMNLRVHSA